MEFGACPFPAGTVLWAYLRYSSDDQNIASQESFVLGWCVHHRVLLGAIFKDEAKSGTSTAGRDEFLRMIALLEKDPAPRPVGVVCWDLKRWARNFDDSQYFKSHLRRLGYVLYSIQDQIPDTREGRLLEAVHDWSNEQEALKRREDTKRGLHDLAARGFITGGFPPIGYRRSAPVSLGRKKSGAERLAYRLEIDPETEKRVRLAWQMKLAGRSHWEIHAATHVTASVAGLGCFFKSVTYAGAIKCGTTVNWDAHAGYVSRADWERVQVERKSVALRNVSARENAMRERRGNPFLLSGLLRCGECGWLMVGTSNQKYRYYRCDWRHRQGHKQVECRQPSLIARALHEPVLDWLEKEAFSFEQLVAARDRINAEVSGATRGAEERREFLVGERKRLGAALQRLMDGMERGGWTEELQSRMDERRLEVQKIDLELAEIEARVSRGRLEIGDEVLAYVSETIRATLDKLQGTEEGLNELRGLIRGVIRGAKLFRSKVVIEYSLQPLVEALMAEQKKNTATGKVLGRSNRLEEQLGRESIDRSMPVVPPTGFGPVSWP